jgi:hypothetical protein
MKNPSSRLNAQKLRSILIVTIFLIVIVAAALFVYGRHTLDGYATEVKKVNETVASSNQNLSALNTLKTKLAENSDAVDRTKNLVAESKSYAYQDQIIADLNAYAKQANVAISGFEFNTVDASTPGSTGAATPSAPAPSTGAAPTTPAPVVGGLKTTSVSVTLKSPLPYKNVMKFTHMIEQNLTKMQLTGISFNKDQAKENVTVDALTIEVYIK